jgi:hypothetical protein
LFEQFTSQTVSEFLEITQARQVSSFDLKTKRTVRVVCFYMLATETGTAVSEPIFFIDVKKLFSYSSAKPSYLEEKTVANLAGAMPSTLSAS